MNEALKSQARDLGLAPLWEPLPRRALGYEWLKHYCEPFLAVVLLMLLVPVFVVVAILIKLDDSGPIFFHQMRVGKGGRLFQLLKFRSMRPDVDPYHEKPQAGDQWKVTRVGKFLREKGLDELPQLTSVIKGEMQLIGPRPEMPHIVQGYTARERLRLQIDPGITGYWQVCAPKGEPMHHNLEFDLYYIAHRGFLLDCWIVKETLKILLGIRSQ